MMKFSVLFLALFLVSGLAWADKECSTQFQNLYRMDQFFEGEDIGVHTFRKAVAFFRDRPFYVKYLNEKEREEHVLDFRDGQFYIGNRKLNCTLMACHKIFVVDLNGRILVGTDLVHKFHHSSFLAGGDVLAAGRIKFYKNKIVFFDNYSGHYTPTDYSNLATLVSILQRGFELPEYMNFVSAYPDVIVGREVRLRKYVFKDMVSAIQEGRALDLESKDVNFAAFQFVLQKYGY